MISLSGWLKCRCTNRFLWRQAGARTDRHLRAHQTVPCSHSFETHQRPGEVEPMRRQVAIDLGIETNPSDLALLDILVRLAVLAQI